MTLVATRAGLFVGGRGSRMGGVAKGLLPHPETGEPLVLRLARICGEAGLTRVSLVGRNTAYSHLNLPVVEDAPGVEGPLAGLIALLGDGPGPVVALACDMPFVSAALVARLARERPGARVLLPRGAPGAPFEPLVARYAEAALPLARELAARGERSLQSLLRALGPDELILETHGARELTDWDRPEDID